MGYRWDEVHDEAEQLEHVVSDRLIDRMDEMLGRPEVDPHGDPIPDPEGIVKPQAAQTLLTCPLHTPRDDHARDRPGQELPALHREPPPEAGRVDRGRRPRRGVGQRARPRQGRAADHDRHARGVEGARARAARGDLLLLACAASRVRATGAQPFEILDNSFLVEEAFNQEPGIFQNIFGVRAADGDGWEAAFTQEWPLFTQTHQFSYTVGALGADGATGIGRPDDQLPLAGDTGKRLGRRHSRRACRSSWRPATRTRGFGSGGPGWQVNLPFSKQFGDTYLHWNAGFTHMPSAEVGRRASTTC